jgi:hypothetical protein
MKTIRSMIYRNCLSSWNQSKITKSYTEILLIAMVPFQGLSRSSNKKQQVGIVLFRICLNYRILSTSEAAEMMTILMTSTFWARLSGCLVIANRPIRNETLCCLRRVEQKAVYLFPSWCRRYSKTVNLTIIW